MSTTEPARARPRCELEGASSTAVSAARKAQQRAKKQSQLLIATTQEIAEQLVAAQPTAADAFALTSFLAPMLPPGTIGPRSAQSERAAAAARVSAVTGAPVPPLEDLEEPADVRELRIALATAGQLAPDALSRTSLSEADEARFAAIMGNQRDIKPKFSG
jgi:hypothetical protein